MVTPGMSAYSGANVTHQPCEVNLAAFMPTEARCRTVGLRVQLRIDIVAEVNPAQIYNEL